MAKVADADLVPDVGEVQEFDDYVEAHWSDQRELLYQEAQYANEQATYAGEHAGDLMRDWWDQQKADFRRDAWWDWLETPDYQGWVLRKLRERLRRAGRRGVKTKRRALRAERQADLESACRLTAEQRAQEAEQRARAAEEEKQAALERAERAERKNAELQVRLASLELEPPFWCQTCQAPARELECRQCGNRVR
jgi:hypothetical protein